MSAPSIWLRDQPRPTVASGARPGRSSVWVEVASGRGGGVSSTPAAIPPTFDAIFQRQAAGVPMQFLKSNAYHESGFDPTAQPKDKSGKVVSSALGLHQIIAATLKAFNQANRFNYTSEDLKDPEKNTQVIVWLINDIAHKLNTNAAWPTDWDDPNFVAAVYLSLFGSTRIPAIIAKMHNEGVPASGMTTAAIRKRAGELYPAEKIEVDPTLADAEGKGPYLSHPEVGNSVAMKLRDYLALRGASGAQAAPVVDQVAAAPVDASRQTAPASSRDSIPTWGKALLALAGGFGLYKLMESRAEKAAVAGRMAR